MNGFWNDFLRQILIAPTAKKRRKPRSHRVERLESRALLTSSTVLASVGANATPQHSGSFLISISPAVPVPVEVNYALSGSALEDGIQQSGGSVMIPANQSSTSVPVSSYSDGDGDATTPESLTLSITGASPQDSMSYNVSVTYSSSPATMSVTESDPPGTSGTSSGGSVYVTVSVTSEQEGADFPVNGSVSGLSGPATLYWNDSASDNGDLQGVATSGSIPVSNGAYSFSVPTTDDGGSGEGSQTLDVTVTVGTATSSASAAITEDNDVTLTPALSVSYASATEGQPMAFTVSYSGMPVGTQIDYSTGDGSATAPTDDAATSP